MSPKELVKNIYSETIWKITYRIACRNYARKMLKSLRYHQDGWKEQFGDLERNTVLTDAQKKQVLALWGPRYKGRSKFTYQFHEFYTQATGHFDPHYIPDDLYLNLIDAWFNDRVQAKALDNKCLYSKLFPQAKQPVGIAYRMNGTWLDNKFNTIGIEKLTELLNCEEEVVVKKATESMGGHGVFFCSGEGLAQKVFDQLDDEKRDIVIQRALVQHPTLAKLNPDSVNTIRHISFLEDGKATVYSSILRMGINHSRVDNASSGGITCGITADGTLKPVAFAVSGQKYEKHHTTGIAFSTITVPSFDKSLAFVKQLHQSFPLFRLLSWDVAIDQEGNPVLLEPNLYVGELDFHQLNNGPLFGEDQDRILSEINWDVPEIFFLRLTY